MSKINSTYELERLSTDSASLANAEQDDSIISIVKAESIVVDVDCDPLFTSDQQRDQSLEWPAEDDGFEYQEQVKQAKQRGPVSNTSQGKILHNFVSTTLTVSCLRLGSSRNIFLSDLREKLNQKEVITKPYDIS